MDDPFAIESDGLRLAVRLTPRARRAEAAGVVAGADDRPVLAVRVAAPPVDGAANEALVAWLAKAVGLPRSAVEILSGHAARVKIVRLAGDPAILAGRVRALM